MGIVKSSLRLKNLVKENRNQPLKNKCKNAFLQMWAKSTWNKMREKGWCLLFPGLLSTQCSSRGERGCTQCAGATLSLDRGGNFYHDANEQSTQAWKDWWTEGRVTQSEPEADKNG